MKSLIAGVKRRILDQQVGIDPALISVILPLIAAWINKCNEKRTERLLMKAGSEISCPNCKIHPRFKRICVKNGIVDEQEQRALWIASVSQGLAMPDQVQLAVDAAGGE